MAEEKSGNILLGDDKGIYFGDGNDASITYIASTDTLWFNATSISGLHFDHTHTMDDIEGEVGPEDLATLSGALHDEVVSVSGSLQDQLDNFSGMEIHGNEYHSTTFATVSGLDTVSGVLQTQIDNLDLNYATDEQLNTVSGALHEEIENFDGMASHGNEYHTSTFITSADLSGYATTLYVDTVSGALNASKAALVHTHDDRYYTESEVDTISGAIITQVLGSIEEGITSITNNTDEVDISFSAVQANTDYVINATIQNTIDVNPSKYVYIVISKTIAGFTLGLSSPVDSGNYKVDWRINGVVANTSHTHTTFDYGVILTSSGSYNGEIMTVVVDDANASFGKVLSQGSDFHYDLAIATISGSVPSYVMSLETSSGTKNVLVKGQVCNTAWNWNAGKVYLSTVSGSMTQTVVSGTGQTVQVLGWALSADTIMFNPTYMVVGVV